MSARRFIEDHLLTWLQKGCDHPGEMVAVDILEGSADDVEVQYCRRCGAVKPVWLQAHPAQKADWRTPMPNLWRG